MDLLVILGVIIYYKYYYKPTIISTKILKEEVNLESKLNPEFRREKYVFVKIYDKLTGGR